MLRIQFPSGYTTPPHEVMTASHAMLDMPPGAARITCTAMTASGMSSSSSSTTAGGPGVVRAPVEPLEQRDDHVLDAQRVEEIEEWRAARRHFFFPLRVGYAAWTVEM